MKFTKKIKEEIISGIMAGTIIISPFINISNFNRNKTSNNNDSTKETTSTIETATNEGNKKAEDFIAEVKALDSIYNYDFEDITIPDNLDKKQKCNESYVFDSTSANSIYETATYLVKQIKDNSVNYINEHQNFTLGFLNSIEDSNKLDRIATQTLLKDAIMDILKNGTNKDICLIKDLKFVISYDHTMVSTETYISYVKEDNLLIIFPNNIRNSIENKGQNFWNTLRYAIQYELNNIRQQPCKCQKDVTIFPYETIKDAAIQSELYNSRKIETLINNTETSSESLILALGLFHDNVTIINYYDAIFNNDIESFYKFCGVIDNEEAIYKLNRILYAIDIINGKNSIDMDISVSSVKEIVGYDYRFELFSMIINNMIRYTESNKDFKLKDNLILFSIIKNIVMTDIETNNNDDALENIAIINNIYIEFLSKHYEVSIDKIKKDEVNDDIINSVLATLEICNKNDDVNIGTKYILYSYKLVDKFPLLKQILSNSSFYPLEYQNIINDNSITLSHNNTLTKKK